MEQGSRTKLIAAFVLLLVFGSGLVVGYALDGRGPGMSASAEAVAGDGSAGERRPWVPVYQSMNPTPEQLAVIESIMASHRERMNLLHEEVDVAQQAQQTRYDALIQQTRNAITAVFPEERRAEYRRRLEAYDRERAAERAKRGDRQ
jgi:hypothetical protein